MSKEESIAFLKEMNIGTHEALRQQALAELIKDSILPNEDTRKLVKSVMCQIKNDIISNNDVCNITIYDEKQKNCMYTVERLLTLLGYSFENKSGYAMGNSVTIDFKKSRHIPQTSVSESSSNSDNMLLMGAIGLGLGIVLF